MTLLRESMRIELVALLACFAAVLAWRILHEVSVLARHAETRRAPPSWRTRAIRLQMPVVSLMVAFLYLVQLRRSAGSGNLPQVPEYALALLAGSQAVFLSVMARCLLRSFGILRNEGKK
jgi:hypothetical protein